MQECGSLKLHFSRLQSQDEQGNDMVREKIVVVKLGNEVLLPPRR